MLRSRTNMRNVVTADVLVLVLFAAAGFAQDCPEADPEGCDGMGSKTLGIDGAKHAPDATMAR